MCLRPIHWRNTGALWFNQQWGEGSGEPRGIDMAAWLHFSFGVNEQFSRGDHDYYSNFERGPAWVRLKHIGLCPCETPQERNGIPPPTLSYHTGPLPEPLTPAGCSSVQVSKPPYGAVFPIPPQQCPRTFCWIFSSGPCTPGSG